ncbi:unnamed protein product [Litomosoides sigmodontis]|uniref:PDZ domain-containing protein n=1 Tax=Litomosoides sigmodontis TaxID=42156 RepID=A0A3P6SHZ4_LITSI|nr:unnamed protein product [Litomosoides sigmodontis]
MVGKRLLLKRSSVDVPYGFIIRHVTFYPPKDGLIDAVKYVQKPIYVLAILSVKSASAADEAGLRAGHQIIGLNGRDANHLTYNDLCKITERLFTS